MRPDLFENPGLLEAGSLPMSPISGPWYATLDIGLRKNIPVGFSEAARLQLRIDFFNILNRTNFNVTSISGITGLGITNFHDPNDTDFGLFNDTFSARADAGRHEAHVLSAARLEGRVGGGGRSRSTVDAREVGRVRRRLLDGDRHVGGAVQAAVVRHRPQRVGARLAERRRHLHRPVGHDLGRWQLRL